MRAWTLGVLLAGCGSARVGVPVEPPVALSVAAVEGKQVFQEYCHTCHPGGEGGIGLAINNRPIPGFAIRWQVRSGFGGMPAFSREELPPEQLDLVVDYLLELRRADPS